MRIHISYYPPEEGEQVAALDTAIEQALNDPTLWRIEKNKRSIGSKAITFTTKLKTAEGRKAVQDQLVYFENRRKRE